MKSLKKLKEASSKFISSQPLLMLTHVDYLGGYKDIDGKKGGVLRLYSDRIEYKIIKTVFTISKEEVKNIAIEGQEQASKRVTATRILAVGVFALLFKKDNSKKDAFITVELKDGGEVIFYTSKKSHTDLRKEPKTHKMMSMFNEDGKMKIKKAD